MITTTLSSFSTTDYFSTTTLHNFSAHVVVLCDEGVSGV